jgi:pimeloyl-ACP methyl ester carboxylesterase
MPSVVVNHEEIYYASKEGAFGAPVILLHGANGTHKRWLAQVNALQHCSPYALDLPGHGLSTGSGRDSVAAYADVVAGFITALDFSQAVLAGHSLGGGIALWLALHRPEGVRGLVLLATGARLRVHPKILQAVKMGWPIPPDPAADTTPEPPEDREPVDPVAYGDWVACDRFDVLNRLEAITCPTLVIHGSNDPRTPLKYATYMLEHIPNAQLVTIEGAGHNPMSDNPDEVNQAIQQFMNSLP